MGAPPRFLLFDPTGDGWPKISRPQVAFAGRSNVGKSSLLNALVGNARLARVGRTPGRTRGIVFFEIEGRFVFADLPGYGFARVSRSEREAWKRLVEGYLSTCRRLRKVYLLVDIRRGPEQEEEMLADYLAAYGVPCRWVAMKADKVKAGGIAGLASRLFAPAIREKGGDPVIVSARTRTGIDVLWRDIRAAVSD